jgi:hypothetical protein
MKPIFYILVSLLCFSASCIAQITYSVVHNADLHIPVIGEHINDTYIQSHNILKVENEIPTTEVKAVVGSSFYDYPFTWDIQDTLVFAINCIHTKSPEISYFTFFRSKISKISIQERRKRDSLLAIELAKEIPDKDKLLGELFDRKSSKPSLRNLRYIYPITLLFRWKTGLQGRDFHKGPVIDNITFDFIALNSRQFLFYIRDDRQLTIWQYDYPEYREKLEENAWQELITYSRDSIGEYNIPQPSYWYHSPELKYHPSGKQHRYEAIGDSLFFEGHFKVIAQDGEYYCINIDTGLLYHIGDQDIVRIGALDTKDYPRWTFGKRLFIEDRDAGELVFFSTVERTNTKRPFPKIVSLSSKAALYKRYPGIKGK